MLIHRRFKALAIGLVGLLLVAALVVPMALRAQAAPGCQVAYSHSDWTNGFTANVTITNGDATTINGWTLTWTFPGNQQITNLWNGSYTQSGTSVSVKNLSYNATIGANGGSTNFGFNANFSGTNGNPTNFALNGVACNSGGGGGDTQAPSVPTGLTSPSQTSSSISLSWTASTDNVGVTGYDIYRNGTLVGSSTTTSYTDSGLTASTSYTYTVRAKDAAGNVSAASAALTVSTSGGGGGDPQAPSVPTGLTSPSQTSSSISLSWTASTDNVGVTGYDVYRNGTLVGSSTTTTYTDSGLAASTSYSYTVRAKDAAGNVSAVSAALTVSTQAGGGGGSGTCAVVYTPSSWNNGFTADVKITNNNSTAISGWTLTWSFANGQQVTSAWNATVTQSGANVTAGNPASNWNGTIGANGGSASFGFQGTHSGTNNSPTSFTLNGVACNGGGGGGDTQAPSVPTGLTSPSQTSSSISLSWTASTDNVGVTGYDIYRNGTLVGSPTTTSFTDSGLAASTSYTYTVRAKDAAGNVSAASAALTVSTSGGGGGDTQAPTVPTGLTSPSQTSSSISLSWTASTDNVGVTGYDVYRGTTLVGSSTTTSYTDSGLTASTSYTYTVRAKDAAGNISAASAALSVTTSSGGGGGTHADNPFVGATIYRNVDYVASVNAAAALNPSLSSKMLQVANYPTFVWLDSIDAVNGTNGYPHSLVGHMQQAVAQGATAIEIVVYDLPNRDCSALASNGELLMAADGFNRYKNEYINPIASAVAQFPNLRVIAVIEPDSLPNLQTNLSYAKCQEANGAGGYRDSIVYALNTLGAYSNFYSYIDIAHHGWLGWQDSNFIPAGTLIANTIKATDKGVNSIDGFISNTANTSALVEPYHTANQSINGQPARSADFHDWNTYIDELSYAQAWRTMMISNGFPSTIGMLIDTSRNGWGGPNRPTGPSTSTDLNTFVDASRIDRRIHKGNWCNQSGAGIGERPVANPATGIDAYVWVKPPGESDGSSSLIPTGPDNPAGKGFDQMCDPTYTGNSLNGNSMTGALPNAPVSGRWFQAQFIELVTNAFPIFQ